MALVGCNFTFFDVSFASVVRSLQRQACCLLRKTFLFVFVSVFAIVLWIANLFNAKILLSLLHLVETLHSLQNLNYI